MVKVVDTSVWDLAGLGEEGEVGRKETRVGWQLEVRAMLCLSWMGGCAMG